MFTVWTPDSSKSVCKYSAVKILVIPDFIARADLGISTHKQDPFWDLYFSTKIVEFLILGLPVVSSRTRTIKHYFDEDNLFYFTPEREEEFADRVLCVYKNPSIADKKLGNARENIAENMDWQKEKKKYINLVKFLTD